MLPAFHLSLSVSDLNATRAFYCDALGAMVGRATDRWIDLWLFGAQVTAYQRAAAVVPSPFREAQHFGATVNWSEWPDWDAALQGRGPDVVRQRVFDADRGVAKLVLADPDGYLIEIKAYRDPAEALRRPEDGGRPLTSPERSPPAPAPRGD
jgi:extradiol dioxygenase family protein